MTAMNALSAASDPDVHPHPASDALARSAHTVIVTEANAIRALESRVDGEFVRACRLILACTGRVVVTGMGKSGHIARKIAATLASTGTPAFFVHPGEASHGDLGMITRDDVVLALSYSGETDELLTILPLIKRQGNPLIAMTGRPNSSLARAANAHLDVGVSAEACPLGLAPTASTTAALVMGDALAIALLEAHGFTAEDFAMSHPAGSLGRRLLLKIEDLMHTGTAIPQVLESATLTEALMEMSRKGLGMTAIVDAEHRLLGVFTDGDLRRALDDDGVDMRGAPVAQLMTRTPKSIGPDKLAAEAAQLMDAHKIHALIVVDDEQRVVGALNIHDLMRARVV
jgi:arabinose-5-phosphate isomerase